MEKWQRLLRVRPPEAKMFWLFLAHQSLLGIGTGLLYGAAILLLFEYQPARTLPMAYCLSAVALLVAGQLHARFATGTGWLHKPSGPAVVGGIVLMLLLGLVAWRGSSVAVAVALLVGYHLTQLLTGLAYEDQLAVVFKVRQGRRLALLLSVSQLLAKALGVVAAILVQRYGGLYGVLLMALGFFGLALLARSARPQAPMQTLPTRGPARPSSSTPRLAQAMGYGLTMLATVAVGVQYSFLLTIKGSVQGQNNAIQYVVAATALALVLAAAGRVVFVCYGLAWLGVRKALLAVPVGALAGVLLLGALYAAEADAAKLMLCFNGFYMGFEALRLVVTEPVYRLLTKSFTPHEQRQIRAQHQRFYQPLGVGVGGALLLGMQQSGTSLRGLLVLWVGILVAVLFLMHQVYRRYITTLENALAECLARTLSSLPTQRKPAQTPQTASGDGSKHTIRTIKQLHKAWPQGLYSHRQSLLSHPASQVRRWTLGQLGERTDLALLRQLTQQDPDQQLRETASHIACRRCLDTDDLVTHQDVAVRLGAIRGRLALAPADALALKGIAALVAAAETNAVPALALISLLSPPQQAAVVQASLRSTDPATAQALIEAAAHVSSPEIIALLISALSEKTAQKTAAASLVQVGAAALPDLGQVLAQETNGRRLRRLAEACAQMGIPAARQLLIKVAQADNLHSRAAALQALNSFPTATADMPIFQHLVEDEMRLAHCLLHGMAVADAVLQNALRYELRHSLKRLFGLLLQLYERPPMLAVQHSMVHATSEHQAIALETLEHFIPRPLYQGLRAMLEAGQVGEKVQTFDGLLGPLAAAEPIQTTIIRRGGRAFTAWTISTALQQWHAQPTTVGYLYPHLQAADLLVQESARLVLQRLPVHRPAAYDHLLAAHPTAASLLMATPNQAPGASAQACVLLLKGTALFAETPENVLSTVVPIMNVVTFQLQQQIFSKGSLGTSLFIISEGEVGIFDGSRQLTTFRTGDFFGELSLLDAEARSASAVALGPVTAFRIDQEDFYDVLEECPEVMRNIMRVLCQRLRRQNENNQTVTANIS